jgi:sporulation protein YlmC with PRC-barrel domain
VLDASGKVLGEVEQALLGADGKPLADAAQVVRDANGNVIGTVVGDQIIDAQGRSVGSIKDGKAVDSSGKAIEGASLDVQQDVVQIVRDAQGNVIGTLRGDRVYGPDGKLIGRLVDGKVIDANGNVLYRGVTVGLETPRDSSAPKREANRMIQFIPGGTGSNGVIPVQTLRLE